MTDLNEKALRVAIAKHLTQDDLFDGLDLVIAREVLAALPPSEPVAWTCRVNRWEKACEYPQCDSDPNPPDLAAENARLTAALAAPEERERLTNMMWWTQEPALEDMRGQLRDAEAALATARKELNRDA
jgi:hypothetical protein